MSKIEDNEPRLLLSRFYNESQRMIRSADYRDVDLAILERICDDYINYCIASTGVKHDIRRKDTNGEAPTQLRT